MPARSSRRAWTAASFSLFVWVISWVLGFAVLDLSSSTFLYLLFGVAEPLVFLYHLFVSDESQGGYGFLVLLVLLQLALHVVALILRFISLSLPFTVDEVYAVAFFIIELGHTGIYVWYFVASYRHYKWIASGGVQTDEYRKLKDK